MTTRRFRVAVIGAAAVLAVALVAGVVAAFVGARHQRSSPSSAPPATGTGPSPAPSPTAGGFTPTPPSTDNPTQTPVQQQYDDALASGLAASTSVAVAQKAQVPSPAFSSAWPALPIANVPEQWTSGFTQQLLDIDFARQSRSGLGAWLSAEEAPELLPGVPSGVQDKVLYLSLFSAAAIGGGSSPIPDQVTWNAYARSGVRWAVSHLLVQADPQFSQILSSGWQPPDPRFAAEDVTGLLTATQGTSTNTTHFSMVVYVGSARGHAGYGTVLIDNWKQS